LEGKTNRKGKNGFHRITQLLQELEGNINIYKSYEESSYKNIALALVKWYNAIVDHVAQYIRVDLQKFITNNLDNAAALYGEIANANAKDDEDKSITIENSSWEIKGSATMLRYVDAATLEPEKQLGYQYPGGAPFSMLDEIKELKDVFLDAGKIKPDFVSLKSKFDQVMSYQSYITSLLQPYTALTEEQKKGYNSRSIRLYIQLQRDYITSSLYDYEKAVGEGLPEMTKKKLKAYLDQLDNLRNAFEAAIMTREIDIFYKWFMNIEKLFYDWQIDSTSRRSLLEQLKLFKRIKFEFQLPSAIADDRELTLDNVEIRNSEHMENMMSNLSAAVGQINGILAEL
jgi:hypothetical protein